LTTTGAYAAVISKKCGVEDTDHIIAEKDRSTKKTEEKDWPERELVESATPAHKDTDAKNLNRRSFRLLVQTRRILKFIVRKRGRNSS